MGDWGKAFRDSFSDDSGRYEGRAPIPRSAAEISADESKLRAAQAELVRRFEAGEGWDSLGVWAKRAGVDADLRGLVLGGAPAWPETVYPSGGSYQALPAWEHPTLGLLVSDPAGFEGKYPRTESGKTFRMSGPVVPGLWKVEPVGGLLL